MQSSPTFIFQASVVFGLIGRGIVFRGHVKQGNVRVGQTVEFSGRNRTHRARVAAIESDCKLIEQSMHGPELGLLLNDFDEAQINHILESSPNFEAASDMPAPQDLLSIELPVEIHENVV